MNLSSNVFVFRNETDKDDFFFQQIGTLGAILIGVCIIMFFASIGFGIFISIKYFRMKDVVEFANVDLKKRRILIVIHAYIWSIILGIFVLIFSDKSDFPFTSDVTPEYNPFYNVPLCLVYIKFYFIFLLNFHYVLVRHHKYSNWKVNYVLENYRLYLGLITFLSVIVPITLFLPFKELIFLIFMGFYGVVILCMLAVNLGDTNEIQYDAEQPETKLKAATQLLHLASMIIAASAIKFYSVESVKLRIFIMMLIFIEPSLLTLSQYMIYRAKLRDTKASFDTGFQAE